MNTSTLSQNQLLATKFFVPVALGPLICRSRLTALLDKSLNYPLTLISAPAGFGKTTLLSAWTQALPATSFRVYWVSLDEEDNEPRRFWTSILTALSLQQPERFDPLVASLQTPQGLSLKYVLKALINLLAESTEHFLLILDDYQVITEQEVHTTLSYLVEHLPSQLHVLLSTRADPPLPLALLQARQQVLEVRTDQLRCTIGETKAFFKEVIGIQLSNETIQQVTAHTEGWLVGLQLLGLSLPQGADPTTLLEEVSGDQRYILDYLTEEVLKRQPQEAQTFLLSTCILDRFTAPLCDAVMQQTDSQQMLERLEQANLFIVSLDSRHQWYRYHALFAEALRYQLEQTHADLLPTLHYRASLWYAEHGFPTPAILHALHAKEWHWTADLIEDLPPLLAHTWGASEHELFLLRQWLEQLPADIIHRQPRLCLVFAELLWVVTPGAKLQGWLDAAKATLTTSLTKHVPGDSSNLTPAPQAQQDQQDLLGEVIAFCALLQSFQEDTEATLSLCQQALSLLSAENRLARGLVLNAQLIASYTSAANGAIEHGLQVITLTQDAGQPAIGTMGTIAMCMIGAGRLREAHQLTQQALRQGTLPGERVSLEVSLPMFFQAYLLCEWNQLDAACSLAEEAISLCKQMALLPSLMYLLFGYAVLLHIHLSRGDPDAACWALQQFERLGRNMYQPTYLYIRSHFTTVDQVRLWLTSGEVDHATRWTREQALLEGEDTSFIQGSREVACMRVLVAKKQAALVPQRLESVLKGAATGQRWGHVIEIRLLQALAYQMLHEEEQALSALSEAVRLAEPEGYIRSFVDEGAPMATLLSQLRKQQRQNGPTAYLDMLLAAFQQESMAHVGTTELPNAQPLLDPLSKREQEILQLLARGASNQEIAQELVIAIDTVKRHVSHIFSKLAVQNRVQAVRQARALGLMSEEL